MAERRAKWTVLEVLDWTRGHFERKGCASARLDAEVLLASVLGLPRVMLYAQFDRPMVSDELTRMRALVARRAAGEPVALLVGKRAFWDFEVEVTPAVLIPRPETEILIEVARRRRPDASTAVDVGTGSGAIALALAKELPEARVFGLELDPAALEVAKRNAAALGRAIAWARSDLLDELPAAARPVDLVAANLPYIPSGEIAELMPEVRDHEPRLALDGGPDGLGLIRRLIAAAPAAMAPGGVVVLESGPEQPEAIAQLLAASGFGAIEVTPDLAGLPRVTSGVLGG